MQIDFLDVGKQIRKYRTQMKLSQIDLAQMLEVSPSYISYIENGVKFMSLEILIKIANCLNVTTDMILKDCLKCSRVAYLSEFSELLSDCSNFEISVIVDVLVSLKAALRDNAHLRNSK